MDLGSPTERPTLPSDALPDHQRLRIEHQPYHDLPGMAQDPPGHWHEFPPDGRNRLQRPRGRTGEAFKADEQVVRQHPDPGKDRIGACCTNTLILSESYQ